MIARKPENSDGRICIPRNISIDYENAPMIIRADDGPTVVIRYPPDDVDIQYNVYLEQVKIAIGIAGKVIGGDGNGKGDDGDGGDGVTVEVDAKKKTVTVTFE